MVTSKSRKKKVREQGGKNREPATETASERVARITADTRYGECSERARFKARSPPQHLPLGLVPDLKNQESGVDGSE